MRSERHQQKKKKRKKWRWIIPVSILLCLLIGYPLYHAYKSITDPVEDRESEYRKGTVNLKKKDPFSLLLLGVDERGGDRGRSDTLILLTVNPRLGNMKMISIPRDTRTAIVGAGKTDKINHAYAIGGVQMSMDTVEQLTQVPVDFYVKVNMEGFKDMIDAIGGVTVVNRLEFSYDGHHFPLGEVHLNGTEALAYTRMRKLDPNGDAGRQERQRQVIEQVMKKGTSLSELPNFPKLLSALKNHVRTNLTIKDLLQIRTNYLNSVKNTDTIRIDTSPTRINGIYYEIIPEAELQRVRILLRDHLRYKK